MHDVRKPTAISATYPYIPRLATRDPSLVKDASGVYLELYSDATK
jgi:hypothetical protein